MGGQDTWSWDPLFSTTSELALSGKNPRNKLSSKSPTSHVWGLINAGWKSRSEVASGGVICHPQDGKEQIQDYARLPSATKGPWWAPQEKLPWALGNEMRENK